MPNSKHSKRKEESLMLGRLNPKKIEKLDPEEKELVLELIRRKEQEPIRYWEPHTKQRAASNCDKRIRVVLGGNRSGKSEWGTMETIAVGLGFRPWLDENDPNYWIREEGAEGIKIRIVGEDLRNHIMGVLLPKMREWLPKKYIKYIKKNPQGVETFWVLENGTTIEYMSYEQDSEKFEGWDGDLVWFDEPPRYAIYIACWRGLTDRGGRMLFTMTPLKEPWIKEKIWDKTKDPKSLVGGFVFSTYDNIGYGLKKQHVKEYEDELTEDEKQARIHGQFLHLSGRVYNEFKYQTHAIEPFKIPPDWAVYEAIDPHPRTPHAVMWVAVGPDETKYVVDELFREGTIQEIAQYIKAKREINGFGRIRTTLIDPMACTPNPINGVNIQNEFSRCGVYSVKASKDLIAGIPAVKNALKEKFGKPELFVMKNCKETLREFENYVWDEYRGRGHENKTPPNKPRDIDDHMMENLYRIILFKPKYKHYVSKRAYEDIYQPNSITGY